MSKEKNRGNKEVRKPKAAKAVKSTSPTVLGKLPAANNNTSGSK
jgi:hypothetical protein